MLCYPFVSRAKRRTAYFTAMTTIAIGNTILASYYLLNKDGWLLSILETLQYLPVVGFGLLFAGFAMGLAQVWFQITDELLPSQGRGIGNGIISFLAAMDIFITVRFVRLLWDQIGIGYLFVIFSCVAVFMIVFAYTFVPETQGKTLEEIQEYYRQLCYGDREAQETKL